MTMKVGLLCGREYSFPPAFIDRVNTVGGSVFAESVRCMAFQGRTMTLKSTICPASFQRMRSTPLMCTPSSSQLNSSAASCAPTISRR